MSFLAFFGARSSGARSGGPGETARDCTLTIFTGDVHCQLLITDQNQTQLAAFSHDIPAANTGPRSALSLAIANLSPEWQDRIGDVRIFMDDAEIVILDSRQAKLTHFEGRALAEFGKCQMGGKPVAFGSHAYGLSSVQEVEKRIIGYISEDRLSAVLFALGKLAKYASFCGPWSLQSVLADAQSEPRAKLSVHGAFSTLTLANGPAGAVAVRHLPVGTANFGEAYAQAYALPVEDAAAALRARPRLTIGADWPPSAKSPAAHLGSHLSLGPVLSQLAGEINTTTDYFEFQRLAGRVSAIELRANDAIAGLGAWLGKMLQLDIEPSRVDFMIPETPALNFLEGMRSGLLKLGNQLYDFTGGRFVVAQSDAARTAKAVSPEQRRSNLVAAIKTFFSQPLTLSSLRSVAAPLILVGLLPAIAWAAQSFWLGPLDDQLTSSASLYDGTLAQTANTAKSQTVAAAEPILWARDIISIAALMPYDMKITHLTYAAAKPGSAPALDIVGALPKSGADNLQLVGKFMARLTGSKVLRRRVNDLTFAGAGDQDKDAAEMQFHLSAKVLGVVP